MQITLRLHRQHDMDLINLYYRPHFKFQKEIKKSLVEYASGRIHEMVLPDEAPSDGYVAKTILMHISLNPNKPEEKAAIDLLSNVKKGFRNSFIKAVFRITLPSIPLTSYMADSGFRIKKTSIFDTAQGRAPQTVQKTVSNPAQTQSMPVNPPDTPEPVKADADSTDMPEEKDTVVEPVTESENVSTDAYNSLFAEMAALNH